MSLSSTAPAEAATRRWLPRQVLVTASARDHEHAWEVIARCRALDLDVIELPGDRLTGLRGDDPRETYRRAKSTLAVVVAPPSQLRPQPIPPSADWRLDLARGCPAHCQYCYLAGSLPGVPVTRVFANLDQVLAQVDVHEGRGTITSRRPARQAEGTTFEASCYTDPLGIEHLTGSLARAIRFFGRRPASSLRFTTKFDAVDALLGLPHHGRTRARFSVNAPAVEQVEGGTARVDARLRALRRMAQAGYPVGLTIAPIVPGADWREQYGTLLRAAADATDDIAGLDLTVELITHRFTPGSKQVLKAWYPASPLDMDETIRAHRRTRFGGEKFVYPPATMRELRAFFTERVAELLPAARILYFT